MPTLAIIHTTPATVAPLKALAQTMIPGVEVINFVDDSILPQLARNGGDLAAVEERLVQYAVFAEQVGADVILEACSSVGEVVARMAARVSIPVVRIDEAMAEAAVRRGTRIGVIATLATTLNPTVRLIESKAAGQPVTITTALADSAYQRLMTGDQAGHDEALLEKLAALVQAVDVVVLAQASMARVVPALPASEQGKILSSPTLGMERVAAALGG
ncbi:MAG: aspartate/glutamate racemase family protein [Anaerolineae bacterium]|nr:aspartate/glutamate racemase family protein [Anaerolineae bacterium]